MPDRIVAVHLDLKGVPPTFSRLLQLLPLFRAAGYNAILVEWEDMFPWTVDKRFRNATAYTREEVTRFHEAARKEELEIIPLVQCLGHVETPLQFPEYAGLRELPHKSDVLNPLAKGARELVEKMIDDVLALTPNLRYFHLGGDEAWTFGCHPDTKAYIEEHGKGALYLHHVNPLLEKLLAKKIRPILWHDMMIHWEPAALRDIAGKADLCVWGYKGTHAQTQSHWQPQYMDLFRDHGITMWGATAYKGAEFESEDLPDVELRQINCQSWSDMSKRYEMKGLIATAWSRYSTDRVQDSPIDASLDALVVCGRILRDGHPPVSGEALAILDLQGESVRHEPCRDAMRQLQNARQSFWARIQYLREGIACASLDDRRRASGTPAKYLGWLKASYDMAKEAAEEGRKAMKGLVPAIWVDRYMEERLTPMRAELRDLAPQVKALNGEAFRAEFPNDLAL